MSCIACYADDVCLLALGKFPNKVSRLIQWVVLTVEKCCNEVGLSVNSDKNGLVAFTSKRKLPGFFEPQFFGVKLIFSGSVKYLGVILDSRLTWREHVDVKMRKEQNLLWSRRRAGGARMGLKPKVVHWPYLAIVRPTISFTALVWRPGCQAASAKKRISKVRTKTNMLRDNGSDSYNSYWYYGGNHWPPSAGSSDAGGREVGSTSPLGFGVLVLPSPQSRTYLLHGAESFLRSQLVCN